MGVVKQLTQWIKECDLAYQIYAGSRKTAENIERSLFWSDDGKNKGMALAPLEKVSSATDVAIVYCNSKDVLRLSTATAWRDGDTLKVTVAVRYLCSDGVSTISKKTAYACCIIWWR